MGFSQVKITHSKVHDACGEGKDTKSQICGQWRLFEQVKESPDTQAASPGRGG